jgi:hypothetical protein
MEEGAIACQLLLDLYNEIPAVSEPIYRIIADMLEIGEIEEFLRPQIAKFIANLGANCPPQILLLNDLLEESTE